MSRPGAQCAGLVRFAGTAHALHSAAIDAIVPAMSTRLWLLILVGCASSPRSESPTAQPPPPHHGAMHHRFDRADDWAKVFDDPARDAWQQPERVLAALALGPKMTVVDVGAGTGYFAVRLARAVPDGQVIATDIEPDMIRYLTERAEREGLRNLRAVLTPPADPQLPADSVDRILVVDVWHHVDDRAGYARALAQGLRQGGRLAIVDFKASATHGPPAKHRLAPSEIAGDLQGAGLTVSVDETALPEQYIVFGAR